MECIQFIGRHLYELSRVPNYLGAELTDLYCIHVYFQQRYNQAILLFVTTHILLRAGTNFAGTNATFTFSRFGNVSELYWNNSEFQLESLATEINFLCCLWIFGKVAKPKLNMIRDLTSGVTNNNISSHAWMESRAVVSKFILNESKVPPTSCGDVL